MEARLLDENGRNGFELQQYVSSVEVYLLAVNRPLCELCQ